MEEKQTINVLWTGGLDSTYLIVKLCEIEGKNYPIQPYYIVDEKRKSAGKELLAIRNITAAIRQSGKAKRTLLDAIIVERKSITEYPDITAAWNILYKEYTLGSQYDWLARFARQENINLMVGVQMESRGKVVHTLEGKEMQKAYYGDVEVYSTKGVMELRKETALIFANMLFPCFIVGVSKVQEWEELHQWGFGEVAKMTWFCHNPILGQTCGQCNPCKDALNEGMAFRVSKTGRFLGSCRSLVKKTYHLFLKS